MLNRKFLMTTLLIFTMSPTLVQASNVPIPLNLCSLEGVPQSRALTTPSTEQIPMNYDIFMDINSVRLERIRIENTQRAEEEEVERRIKIEENNIRLMNGTPGQQALKYALEEIGKPYYWGAEGVDDYDEDGDVRDGYDCSGLIQWAYWKSGYRITRTTSTQWREGQAVSKNNIQEGDLIYFLNDRTSEAPVDHVGIYLGGNKMLHAPRPGKNVEVRNVPWGNMVTIRRNQGIKWQNVE